MFSVLRKRLTYTNVAMTLALVFTMSGGAFAAKKYLISSTKQISPKVLAQLKGAKGPAGPAGAQGPEGKAGAQGVPGKDGTNGVNGKEGKEGQAGPPGPEGNIKATLSSKATETGDWSIDAPEGKTKIVFTSVSFNIPLAGPVTNAELCGESGQPACVVHYLNTSGKEWVINAGVVEEVTAKPGCTGNVGEPGAEPGNLCVFTKYESNINHDFSGFLSPKVCEISEGGFYGNPNKCPQIHGAGTKAAESQVEGADTTGFGVSAFALESGKNVEATGSWAVTAP